MAEVAPELIKKTGEGFNGKRQEKKMKLSDETEILLTRLA